MKKFISVLLIISMLFAFTACGEEPQNTRENTRERIEINKLANKRALNAGVKKEIELEKYFFVDVSYTCEYPWPYYHTYTISVRPKYTKAEYYDCVLYVSLALSLVSLPGKSCYMELNDIGEGTVTLSEYYQVDSMQEVSIYGYSGYILK